MPVAPSFPFHGGTHADSDKWLHSLESKVEIFHSAVGKCRLLMLVLDAYARYPTCWCWIARAPFLGAHTDCLSSELGSASCCLLAPAGFTEKYHRVLTEAQLSRMSGGIGVLILLFTQAVCVFPKPQNQPDTCLALPVLEQEACGLRSSCVRAVFGCLLLL